MEFTEKTLEEIASEDGFCHFFQDFTCEVLHNARLWPRISKHKLIEAHGAWRMDLKRLDEHERFLEDGLDHFKHAGHLAFWLRRFSPIYETFDMRANLGDSEGYGPTKDEGAFRDLLFAYVNEYVAFDLGFQICRFYEIAREDASPRAPQVQPTVEYYQMACHFLKYKTVSPHAIMLAYKSLFMP